MVTYIKNNKKTIFIVAIITTLFCVLKLKFSTIGYDTDEWLSNSVEGTLNTWLGIGRYSLVFMKCFVTKTTNLFLINMITYIHVFLYTVLFLYFLNIGQESSDSKRDLLSAIALISSPIFLEQYYFTLQSAEVSFAMLLVIITFITTYKMLTKKNIWYAIVTICLLLFCFGLYQAFVNVYVVGVIICLYKLNRENKKENLMYLLMCIIVFLVSLVGYVLISKGVIQVLQVQKLEYLQIGWLSLPLKEALFTVIVVVGRILLGHGNILNLAYTACLCFVLYKIVKNTKRISWKNFYLFSLLLSPFLLNILTASRLLIRSALSIPIVCVVVFFYYYEISRVCKFIIYVTMASQMVHCVLLTTSEYNRYKNDIFIANDIYNTCQANADTVIVFKGIESVEENIFAFKGQAMGHSFFEWTADEYNAEESRILYFMGLHNMPLKEPSQEQINKRETFDFEAEYPDKGCIVEENDVYYVNLGK